MGELPSQSYTLFDIPRPQVPFVHVHPGAEELGRVYSPQLAINATPTAFAAALETLKFARAPAGDAKAAHADYLAWTEKPTEQPGKVNFGAVMVWLRDNLAARRHPVQRRRQLLPPGFTASFASAASASMSRRPRARWAMACRRRWR